MSLFRCRTDVYAKRCYSKKYKSSYYVDHRLVWYGSINLLSYGNSEESIMRLESREVAEELGAGLS